ncbi:GNAT family N-acetyltransferase [Saccharopolyspora sp. 5N708]|uniref:GNAT family N-acetyltransferase n=1 Tax=Saccharopolyspora sp. 5N708 TaxID=3457424 RepID=UPI003FD43DE6
MRIETVGYDHPDAMKLIDALQQEYVVRYGEEDVTVVDPTEFQPPNGLFLVGYLDDCAVASGGWRIHDGDEAGFQDGDAEFKRMYIVPEARGKGLARRLLAELETTAVLAGRKRLVLETGMRQPEAIGLYTSSGYTEIEKFGAYRNDPLSRCFAKEL